VSTAVTLGEGWAGSWPQRQRSARGMLLLLALAIGFVGMVWEDMHGSWVVQQQ